MFGSPIEHRWPCVTEPEDGALFPNNWLRPRVRVPGSTGALKITFHADMEANDLVAYTTQRVVGAAQGRLDEARAPRRRAGHHRDGADAGGRRDIGEVPGRARRRGRQHGVLGGESRRRRQDRRREHGSARAIVDDSMLMGFTVGDESTAPTLKITDVKQQVALQNGTDAGSHCIGCHTGTPDGDYVAFVDAWPWGAAFAGVKPPGTTDGFALPGFSGGTCRTGTTARRRRHSCSTRGTDR